MRGCICCSTHLKPGFDVNYTTRRLDAGQAFFLPPTKLGTFHVPPTQRFVLEGKKLVLVSSRALGNQTVLLERSGELVSKQGLMARVWPPAFIKPANLMDHMSVPRAAAAAIALSSTFSDSPQLEGD
jgi:hypothetical protein